VPLEPLREVVYRQKGIYQKQKWADGL